MLDDYIEDDDYDAIGQPVTYDPAAKALRPVNMTTRNAHIRFAVIRSLHGTDKRNRENADSELFWLAAKLIAGEYEK